MQRLTRLILLFMLVSASEVHAQTADKTQYKNFAAEVTQLLDNYVESWSSDDTAKRLDKLNKLWLPNGSHQTPYGISQGIEEISAEIGNFLKSYPNVTVTLKDIKITGYNVVCNFSVAKADGSILFQGSDYFEFNPSGKLIKVIGFILNQ